MLSHPHARHLAARTAAFAFVLLAAGFARADDDKAALEKSALDKTGLARQAQAVLKANCYRCHGEGGNVEGGMNYVLDLERLVARKKVVPGKPDDSPIFKRVASGKMPPPDESPRPSDADKLALRQWIEAGAPPLAPPKARTFVTQADVEAAILADLEGMDRRSRRFMRYFTLTHLHNAGLSADELQTYRNALAKLINSLSWHPKIRLPEPVDPNRTVLRIDLRWFMWDSTLWNRILNDYPYGVLDDSAAARAIAVATASRLPVVRGDWFIATASRPPLYQEVLQLPASLAELERQLRVDPGLDITQERVVRVAFNGSGVARNNRVLERHDAVHGYYWRTYDFEEVPQNLVDRGLLAPDRRNVFAYPLGPGNLENQFLHAGGEAIFSLPNGLQGYFIVNANNVRLDKAPVNIVSDPKRPDRTIELGVSCMSCHIPGIIPKADQLRDHLDRNPKAFSRTDAEIIRALYPPKDKSLALMEEDGKKYRDAVAKTGARVTRFEPVSTMTNRYEADLDATTAAAEVGMPLAEFREKLGRSEVLMRNLGALRVEGGTVARQVWVQAFGDLVRDLKLGVLFQAGTTSGSLPDNTGDIDPLESSANQANHMAFSADGRRALIASADRSIRLYEVEGRRDLKRFIGHTASVWCVAFSPDGRQALSGSMDGTVRLWDAVEGRELRKLDGHLSLVTAVAFTPDGRRALSGGFDGTVILWDLTDGKEVRRLEGPFKYVNALAVSPDGKTALIAADRVVRVWDLESGKEVGKLEGHANAVAAVCFSPDGKHALTGGDDRSVRLWDVASGKQVRRFDGHEGNVKALAFMGNGKWALSGGSDGAVRLWQVGTGKELGVFRKHDGPVVAVGFLDNGKQTLSGSRDSVLHLWNIEKFYPTTRGEKP